MGEQSIYWWYGEKAFEYSHLGFSYRWSFSGFKTQIGKTKLYALWQFYLKSARVKLIWMPRATLRGVDIVEVEIIKLWLLLALVVVTLALKSKIFASLHFSLFKISDHSFLFDILFWKRVWLGSLGGWLWPGTLAGRHVKTNELIWHSGSHPERISHLLYSSHLYIFPAKYISNIYQNRRQGARRPSRPMGA